MEPEYTAYTTYDEIALQNVNAAYYLLGGRKQLIIIYAFLSVVLCALIVLIATKINGGYRAQFTILILGIFLLVSCLNLRTSAYVKNSTKKSKRLMKSFGTDVLYQFYPDYIRSEQISANTELYYNAIDSIVETNRFFLLFIGRVAYAVDKTSVAEEDVENLGTFLEARTGKRICRIKY